MKTFYAFEKNLWYETRNVELKINPFESYGDKPVLRRSKGNAPDNHRAIFPSVFYNGNHFTMWYTGLSIDRNTSLDDYRTVKHTLCIAYSDDGINWHKPNLKKKIKGLPQSKNALLTGFLSAGVDYLPEFGKYSMSLSFANGNKQEGGQTTFCIGTSDNGLDIEYKKRPVIPHQHFESYAGPKKINDRYWIIGQGVSPHFKLPDGSLCGRTSFGFHSEDLHHWELYPHPLFYYPAENNFNKKFPTLCMQNHLGFTVWPKNRIHLGFAGQMWPGGFSENVRFTVGLIYSYDGLNWHEPFPKEPILSMKNAESWNQSIIQGNSLYDHNDKTCFWYTGGDHQGNTWKTKCDIGMATVRRDGFAYFSSSNDLEKVLVTNPIQLGQNDSTIYVNAKANKNCPLTIEPLDKYLLPITEKKIVLSKNSIAEKKLDIREISKKTDCIRLRFSWSGKEKHNQFYGFSISGNNT